MKERYIIKKWRVLKTTMVLQMKKSLIRPMYRFCLFANPIVNTILLYEMFLNSGQENFGVYVILGAGLMGLWGCICFSSAGDINRERWEGTLSLIFVAPADFHWIISGKILGNTLLSLLAMLISFLTARILFGITINILHPLLFIIGMFTVIITFSILSELLAYLFTLSRKTTLYMNCIEIPIIFVCGFVVPHEALPEWLQMIGRCLPPTWAVRILRISCEAVAKGDIFFKELGILLVINLIYALGTVYLVKRIEKQVRINASLEVS